MKKYQYLAEHGSPEEIAEVFHDLLEIAEDLQEKIGKQQEEIQQLRKIEAAARLYSGKAGVGHPHSCALWDGGICNCGADALDDVLDGK